MQAPPELICVRTKGHPNNDLSAIQLVFSEGIESLFFDVNNSSSNNDGVREVNLTGKKIKKITSHCNDDFTASILF